MTRGVAWRSSIRLAAAEEYGLEMGAEFAEGGQDQ